MLKKFVPVALAIALVCGVCGKTVSAKPSDPEIKVKTADAPTASTDGKKDARSGDKLKQDVLKMVADAKAGKTSIPSPQIQTKRNNLSKGQKIAIGVGIAAAVAVLVLVYRHKRDNLFPDNLRVF